MTKTNQEIYYHFKSMCHRGEIAPVRVVLDPNMGFVVRAEHNIPDRTLIVEYAGEVDFLKNRRSDSCDSIMDLLITGDSATSLVIVPRVVSSMARFFSGINNQKNQRPNLRSARFQVDGQVHVLLFAARDIGAGEVLCYDYNGLFCDGYPTEHFL